MELNFTTLFNSLISDCLYPLVILSSVSHLYVGEWTEASWTKKPLFCCCAGPDTLTWRRVAPSSKSRNNSTGKDGGCDSSFFSYRQLYENLMSCFLHFYIALLYCTYYYHQYSLLFSITE